MRPIALSVFLLLLASCASPQGTADAQSPLPCTTVADCPRGQSCVARVCRTAALDAGVFDVVVPPDTPIPLDVTFVEGGPETGPPDDMFHRGAGATAPHAPACTYMPTAGALMPVMECAWRPAATERQLDVVMTPVVGVITDDNHDGRVDSNDTPDIAFVSYDLQTQGCCDSAGTLHVMSGECGPGGAMVERFSVSTPAFDNSGGLAIGDVNGDGFPDIVGMGQLSGVIAVDHTGAVLWTSTDPLPPDLIVGADKAGQPTIADLNRDGFAEVIVGRVVLDGRDGHTIWRGRNGFGYDGFLGPLSVVADLDLDGFPEVVAGSTVYRADGSLACQFNYGDTSAIDGFDAIGNFDSDPQAEIVVVRTGNLYLFNHDCSLIVTLPLAAPATRTACDDVQGGPPTIADVDGDGHPEVGVAGAHRFAVYDFDSCLTTPLPARCESRGILWSVASIDCSSYVTGSSVFDFEGDGVAELIYNDEQQFRIFNGRDGTVRYSLPNCSHTRLEYPIIVDVDNDGKAEIVFVENRHFTGGCGAADFRSGIQVWGSATDNWVPTRRIWNQHSYHITNITEDGRLPPGGEVPSWTVANNYRQNLPDTSVFAAPDLAVTSVVLDTARCVDSYTIVATVCNEGDLQVGRGVEVHFYADGLEATCAGGVPTTTATLLPHRCVPVTCVQTAPRAPEYPAIEHVSVCVDNGGFSCSGPGARNECHEDNNRRDANLNACEILG